MSFHNALTFSATVLTVEDAALWYLKRGYSVIPVWTEQQAKQAAVRWKPYQNQHPTLELLQYWFVWGQHQGVAIVTGRISGVAVLDIDSEERFRAFCEQFPHLAITYIVKTPRGWHLYFRIPTNCTTRSLKGQGSDWQWEKRYVVAPPTQGYSVQNAQNPRLLSQKDITSIESFLDAQTPVFTRFEPTDKLITRNELQTYYTKNAQIGQRNNTLFQTALMARDNGWSLQESIATLAPLHTRNGYDAESGSNRHREALATLKSAFSRPARPDTSIRQLPNTIREKLLSLKQTGTIRLLEGLRLCGYQPGTYVSWQEAWSVLQGIVGRDTIIKALNATNEGNEPLFEIVKSYEKPAPEPPSNHANAAINTSSNTDHKCLMVTNSKSGKSQTMGSPTHYFRLPDNVELARLLGVRLSIISDVLTLEDLKSAKTTRQMLHYRFIERRPGKYSSSWLAKRLGISKCTKNRYDNAFSDLHKTPTYTIKPLYWHNLDDIPDELDVPGQFLEDEQGKRYPPKKVIAIRLLKQKFKLRLVTRGFNYYWIGHRFEVDTDALTSVIVHNQKLPDPDFSRYWEQFYGREHVSVAHKQPERAKIGDLMKQKGVGEPMGHPGVSEPIVRNRYEPLDHNPQRPFDDAHLEAFAQGIQRSLNRMSTDVSKHISLVNARRLVAQYGQDVLRKSVKQVEQRHGVHNPTGLLISILRSGQRIAALAAIS